MYTQFQTKKIVKGKKKYLARWFSFKSCQHTYCNWSQLLTVLLWGNLYLQKLKRDNIELECSVSGAWYYCLHMCPFQIHRLDSWPSRWWYQGWDSWEVSFIASDMTSLTLLPHENIERFHSRIFNSSPETQLTRVFIRTLHPQDCER